MGGRIMVSGIRPSGSGLVTLTSMAAYKDGKYIFPNDEVCA
jgi:hypothetical protein